MGSSTLAIVQARMGSTRLPGKMLLKLGKFTILEWVLRRLKKSKQLTEIILATSNLSIDDSLEVAAKSLGVTVFRGSETDVLGRFVLAGKKSISKNIVRVCADNPFLDFKVIDNLIEGFTNEDYDYGFNHIPWGENSFIDGVGVEILRKRLLEEIDELAKLPEEREHVTRFIWNHWDRYRIYSPIADEKFRFPELSLDVDTKEDYELFRMHLEDYSGFPEDYEVEELISKL
ncbi:cytidylyltransferase domain-containing protein [Leptospira mayottensis]|uniref:cytidylyltransferase domain-containing protein n=1 Tax=Leptospira mayottensis TaxID=1137606 RepID=UPI0002BEEB3E|nr:NTP transferase domain-containing protein [Leptospira mayottensis]AXR61730.1 cytidyltransferase [Leptospira mayottensis]AZQ01822.1 cytidyltransferase [Leptospira mayottensis 200901116]TGN13238.1 cytidyltransferase [Leptospira mayottensis]